MPEQGCVVLSFFFLVYVTTHPYLMFGDVELNVLYNVAFEAYN